MTKGKMYDKIVEYLLANQDKFYRLAYSYSRNKEASLDIVQNAICKAIEKHTDIRDESKVNAWFYRVLLNETYSYLKKNNRELALPDGDMPESVYNEKAYNKDHDLYDQIDSLPKDLKTIVILRFFEDMSLADIACVTNTNLNTVKTRLYSALKKLKKSYEEAGINE